MVYIALEKLNDKGEWVTHIEAEETEIEFDGEDLIQIRGKTGNNEQIYVAITVGDIPLDARILILKKTAEKIVDFFEIIQKLISELG